MTWASRHACEAASSGYRGRVLALLLVAASVGMSNFAAAIAIGVSGVDARTRLRVGLVFGAFETGMPVLGLIIGEQVAATARACGALDRGRAADCRRRVCARRCRAGRARCARPRQPDGAAGKEGAADDLAPGLAGAGRLLLSGLALSLDNLAVGFALGTYNISIAVGAIIIGGVSVTLSLLGLELGARSGSGRASAASSSPAWY